MHLVAHCLACMSVSSNGLFPPCLLEPFRHEVRPKVVRSISAEEVRRRCLDLHLLGERQHAQHMQKLLSFKNELDNISEKLAHIEQRVNALLSSQHAPEAD